MPWVDTGGTANEIHERGYSTVFQVVHDSTQFAQGWLDVAELAAQKLGLTNPTVAIAYSASSYGEEFLSAFNAINKTGGLKVVTSFGYPLTTTDFSSIAARLASANANIVFDMGYPGDGLNLARLFATQFKPKAKVILLGGSDAVSVVGQLKTQADGALMLGDLAPGITGLPASFAGFYSLYEAKFHTAPNSQSLNGYIAMRFIAAALEKAKSASPAAVTEAMRGTALTQTSGNIFPTRDAVLCRQRIAERRALLCGPDRRRSGEAGLPDHRRSDHDHPLRRMTPRCTGPGPVRLLGVVRCSA